MRRRALVGLFAALVLAVGGRTLLAQQAPPTDALLAAPPEDAAPAAPAHHGAQPALPEPASGVAIDWRARNRFRLFRDERDFERHVRAHQSGGVLAAERTLAIETGGRGWAAETVGRLCADPAGGLLESCVRGGVRESYLAPADHPVEVRLAGALAPSAACAWTFDDGDGRPRSVAADCAEPVNIRAAHGRPTIVVVDITADGATRRAMAEILVRDLLIAGLGDSVAAGEGNPDRPVALADEGFCFRQFFSSDAYEYFRPSRAGFVGDKSCGWGSNEDERADWARLAAGWMSAACHRSLYSYQLRAALALAVENPHIAVTFLPLACTGASIEYGLFASQRARERTCDPSGATHCPKYIPGQIERLAELVARAQRATPGRGLDLILLTVGANDIDFSGLVADVMIEARAERALFRRAGLISNVDTARSLLDRALPADFARLRAALKPLLGRRLDRVVFVGYGNPALKPGGGACPGGNDGFDIHPAFGIDGERMRKVAMFVEHSFFPRLKALAACGDGALCRDPENERMTFAGAHQAAFAEHGFCARAKDDPPFDRACFSPRGESFAASSAEGMAEPLRCSRSPGEFRPYASRARWIRTANDSYFAAMAFPDGVSATLQPSNLHDATWGVLSAVYGGAIHPTAEGHAAMADSAVAAARVALGWPQPAQPIIAAPLPEPAQPLGSYPAALQTVPEAPDRAGPSEQR